MQFVGCVRIANIWRRANQLFYHAMVTVIRIGRRGEYSLTSKCERRIKGDRVCVDGAEEEKRCKLSWQSQRKATVAMARKEGVGARRC